MEKLLRAQLLALANATAEHRKMSLSTIGERAVGNWRWFTHIEDTDNSFMVDKYDKAIAWFKTQLPKSKWVSLDLSKVATASRG